MKRTADQIVSSDVYVCMSGLVSRMVEIDESFIDDFSHILSGYDESDEFIEVYEHWSVSQWLADKLRERGERVEDDFYGHCIWGRPTTGQSINMDCVIQAIADSI